MTKFGLFKYFVLLFILLLGCVVGAEEGSLCIYPNLTAENWNINSGAEFPGASGKFNIMNPDNKSEVCFDFSKGGAYIALTSKNFFPTKYAGFSVNVYSSTDCYINYRLVNKEGGRVFQGIRQKITAKQNQKIIFSMNGPWDGVWGGKQEENLSSKVSLWIIIEPINKGEKKGSLCFSDLSLVLKNDQEYTSILKYPTVNLNLGGWKITGKWYAGWPLKTFRGVAECMEGGDSILSLSLPSMSRYYTKRISLKGHKKKTKFSFELPNSIPAIVENHNQYKLYFSLHNYEHPEVNFTDMVVIKGSKSDNVNFGSPKKSKIIKQLPFGTCTHLNFGRSPHFSGWANHKRILDLISKCGFKYIRDSIGIVKNANGVYEVDPYDIQWVKQAREFGINVIAIIETRPDDTLGIAAERARIIASQTKELIDYFELGNEPGNFGWRKAYPGGTWNAKEKDNSTSRWALEHVKLSNAMAEEIHNVRPEAYILGGSAYPPINERYLEAGFSPLIKGIVDHPYTYCLPPELVPFGKPFTKRDGICVGDDKFTFAGLIDGYKQNFKEKGTVRDVCVTEFGFTTYRLGLNTKGMYAGYTERAQAVYLARRFVQSLALGVKITCQYDMLDDYYSEENNAEANFGLLRADYTPKPAYYTLQRMNSLLAEHIADSTVNISIVKSPLHRSMVRNVLIENWDEVQIKAINDIIAYPFVNPTQNDRRMLIAWSARPADCEFNPPSATIKISGWSKYSKTPPVAINLYTGDSFDIPFEVKGSDIYLKSLTLGDEPIAIQFFCD